MKLGNNSTHEEILQGSPDGTFSQESNTTQTVIGESQRAPSTKNKAFIKSWLRSDKLTQQGQLYVDEIKEHFQKNGQSITLTVLPSNGYLFHNDSCGVVVLFEELYPRNTFNETTKFNPISDESYKAMEEVKSIKNFIFIESLVIAKVDYNRSEQMYEHMKGILYIEHFYDNVTLKQLNSEGDKYRINTNKQAVERFHDMYSPHSVRNKCDFGCVFEIYYADDQNNQNNNSYRNQQEQEEKWTPFFAVSTSFNVSDDSSPESQNNYSYFTQQQTARFTPIISITETSSAMPTPALLPLVLGATYDGVGDKNGNRIWLPMFSDFIKSAIYNLGKLITEAGSTEPVYIKDARDQMEFLRECMNRTIIGISVQEGRAGIPYIKSLIAPAGRDENTSLCNIFSSFLDTPVSGVSFVNEGYYFSEVTGILEETAGNYISTTNFDYFKVLNSTKNPEVARVFLYNQLGCNGMYRGNQYEVSRLITLEELGYKDIIPLYRTHNAILDMGVLEKMVSEIGSVLNIQSVDNDYGHYSFLPRFGTIANEYNKYTGARMASSPQYSRNYNNQYSSQGWAYRR